MIRKASRRGKPVLVIDINYVKRDGTKGRYRKDAQVQLMAAARAEERRLLANIATYGEPFAPQESDPQDSKGGEPTFLEAVELFRATVMVTQLKPASRRNYSATINRRFIPEFGDKLLSEITTTEVSKFDAEMVKEGLSQNFRRNVLFTLRRILRCAVDHKLIEAMPQIPTPAKKGKVILRVFKNDQVEAILRRARAWSRVGFALAAYAGLRSGEVRGLRWPDVDLTKNEIIVRRTVDRDGEQTPKSGHQRRIPIAPKLRPLLEEAFKKRKGPWDPVVKQQDGQPLREGALYDAFKRALKALGLEDHWRVHDLRHWFVTTLLRSGVSIETVRVLAGHEHIETTAIYAHVADDDLGQAVALLGNSVETGVTKRSGSA